MKIIQFLFLKPKIYYGDLINSENPLADVQIRFKRIKKRENLEHMAPSLGGKLQ